MARARSRAARSSSCHNGSTTARLRRELKPERICLVITRPLLAGQRRDRPCLVQPYPAIELPRQDRLTVMDPTLRIGAIDDADEALEPGLQQHFLNVAPDFAFAEIEQEALDAAVMAQPLVASR